MARKAREAQMALAADGAWATPNYWLASIGHSVPKPSVLFGNSAIRNAVVVLHLPEGMAAPAHPLLNLAASAQQLLLEPDEASPPAIILMDLSRLLTDSPSPVVGNAKDAAAAALDAEGGSASTLGKVLGKPASRALFKLLGSGMQDVTLLAHGGAAQLALKILGTGADERAVRAVRRLVLVHPRLTAQCVNAQLGRGAAQRYAHLGGLQLDVVFESEAASERRLPALRHVFSEGSSRIAGGGDGAALFVHALREAPADGAAPEALVPPPAYDVERMDYSGRTVWLCELEFKISRDSKQHHASIESATHVYDEAAAAAAISASAAAAAAAAAVSELAPATFATPAVVTDATATAATARDAASIAVAAAGAAAADASVAAGASAAGADEVGALVLRGNRCVLVRSLSRPQAWRGMRIPSVPPHQGEAGYLTAMRAASELCDIDAPGEFLPLPVIPPVALYKPGRGRVLLFPLYAAHGPVGPLEAADEEDDEDLYDWYTWPRAIEALKSDGASIAALRTMACALSSAAATGALPSKWGGVFGQEWLSGTPAAANGAKGQVQEPVQSPIKAQIGKSVMAAFHTANQSVSAAPPPVLLAAGQTTAREQIEALLSGLSMADLLECSAAAAATAAARYRDDETTHTGGVAAVVNGGGPVTRSDQAGSADDGAAGQSEDELRLHALKPLHPERLHAVLLSLKGRAGCRVDGLAWLATQKGLQALVNTNDEGETFVNPGDPWWASVPKRKWPEGLEAEIAPMWHEPHGDRQVELTVSGGTAKARASLLARLEGCLLTAAEESLGPNAFEDPYADEWKAQLTEEEATQRAEMIGEAMQKAFKKREPKDTGQFCLPCVN